LVLPVLFIIIIIIIIVVVVVVIIIIIIIIMLTPSGLTRPEVFSMAFLGSFCVLGCSFFISLGNLLRGIQFTCCIQFLLFPVVFPRSVRLFLVKLASG
jgi:hypothetical protein